MASQYTGDMTQVQPPSAAPSFAAAPVGNLPADGDGLNASSIAQAFKVCLDFIDFLRLMLKPFRGVREWDAGTTYLAGDLSIDPANQLAYRAVDSNTNKVPNSNPNNWARWGHTDAEAREICAKQTDSTGDISATAGATVARAFMLSFNTNALKKIEFVVENVPADSYTDVDLGSSATKFASYVETGHVSMNTGGVTYGGQVGLNLNLTGDKNKLRVWYKKSAGDSATAATVSVALMGY